MQTTRPRADLNRDRWIQSPECWPLHHRTNWLAVCPPAGQPHAPARPERMGPRRCALHNSHLLGKLPCTVRSEPARYPPAPAAGPSGPPPRGRWPSMAKAGRAKPDHALPRQANAWASFAWTPFHAQPRRPGLARAPPTRKGRRHLETEAAKREGQNSECIGRRPAAGRASGPCARARAAMASQQQP